VTPEERAEGERRWRGHQQRQRASDCALIELHWDGAYTITHDGQQYWARRTDNGAAISEDDLLAFREAIRLDHCRQPVPRDATRD